MKFVITESQLNLLIESNDEIQQTINRMRTEQADYWYQRLSSPEKAREIRRNKTLPQDTKNFITNEIEFKILQTTQEFRDAIKSMNGSYDKGENEVGRAIEPKTILINLEPITQYNIKTLPNTLEHEINHLAVRFLEKRGIRNIMDKPKVGIPGLFGRDLSNPELYVLSKGENSVRMNQLRKMLSIPIETTTSQMMDIMMKAFQTGKIKLRKGIWINKSSDNRTIIFSKENPVEPTKSKFNLLQLWQVYTYEIIQSWGNDYEPSDLGALLANASEKSGNEIHLDVQFLAGFNNRLAKNPNNSSGFSNFG